MQMNLKTTITAYPRLAPSMLKNYVQEAPLDGKTYARREGKWVDIISNTILLRYGTSPFERLVDNTHNTISDVELDPAEAAIITSLEGRAQESIASNKINLSITTPECGGYCWICSTVPLNSITDAQTGWTIDYIKQKDNVTEVTKDDQGNNIETVYFCYRTQEELVGDYTFNYTLEVQGDKF